MYDYIIQYVFQIAIKLSFKTLIQEKCWSFHQEKQLRNNTAFALTPIYNKGYNADRRICLELCWPNA